MPHSGTSSRSYSGRTLKILWGRAAGRCAVPECRIELFADATEHDPIVLIGDIAHIEAASNQGPRANATSLVGSRDEYENLILLCKNCHARLDGQKHTNTFELIRQLKADHEAWVREALPERGRSTVGWRVLVLQGTAPIDAELATQALSPDFAAGQPVVITVPMPATDWPGFGRQIGAEVRTLLMPADPYDSRFAVFPLAPVSACIALGYMLTNRPRVRLFQFHRDAQNWVWPTTSPACASLEVNGLPKDNAPSAGPIILCFRLSAQIQRADLPAALAREAACVVDISIPSPTTAWLQKPDQLEDLGRTVRCVFESVLATRPRATAWHIFYAGPAPGAVKVGQQLNPTMSPPVQLYEFNRSVTPPYSASMMLGGLA